MPTTEELLEKLLAVSEELLRWQRAAALPAARETIEAVLTTTQMREAFEACDGTKRGNEVAAAVGASTSSLSNWTRRWRELGIAYEAEGGHIHHLASLKALGVPIEADGS